MLWEACSERDNLRRADLAEMDELEDRLVQIEKNVQEQTGRYNWNIFQIQRDVILQLQSDVTICHMGHAVPK